MGWIYLAESVGSVLLSKSGSDQLPIVRVTDIARVSYCHVCNQATLHTLQSTTMCEISMDGCFNMPGQKLYMAASLAKTSALQVMAAAWRESEADFILKLKGSSKKLSLSLFFSKTYRQLELGGSMRSFSLLPSSGMTVDGQLYQPLRLVPSTFVNDGSYLPTPTASDYGKNNGRNSKDPEKSRDRWSLTVRARRGTLPGHPTGRLNPEWLEQMMGYPIAWTEIKPWAMQWFRNKREKLLKD